VTPSEQLALIREGAIYGAGIGVVLTIVARDLWNEGRRWLRLLWGEYQRRARCQRNDECVAPRGHRGPCNLVEYD
jgi:hypothetical protein